MTEQAKKILSEAIELEKAGNYNKSILAYERYLRARPTLETTIAPSIRRCLAKTDNQIRTKSQAPRPILSVIIPCYNSSHYINECLSSVRQQSLKDIEIIVVNDGSTDGTGSIIGKHAADDSRIHVITNQMPSGSPGKPRNQAISMAQGTFIGFVDSDDWVDEDFFYNMLETANQDRADLVVSAGHRNIFPDTSSKDRRYQHYYFNDQQRIPQTYHPSSMIWDKIYRREILLDNSILLGEDKAAVDVIFVIKAYYYFKNISVCPSIGYNYRRETLSSVTVNQRKSTNCDFEIKAYIDSFEWAKKDSVPLDYIYYIQVKQLSSFLYTLRLVKADFFKDYFNKCSKRVKSYKIESFKDALINTKSFYLWNHYKMLSQGEILPFIKEIRPDLEAYLIQSNKHILPKTIISPSEPGNNSIVFFPDWSYSNPYQRMLYSSIHEVYGIGAIGLEPIEANEANLQHLSALAKIVHLHWTHPFTDNSGELQFLHLLKRCREDFQMDILWTVHNIVPHDVVDYNLEITLRKRLAEMATVLICHSEAAKRKISSTYNVDFKKIKVMPHGLYIPSISSDEIVRSSSAGEIHKPLDLVIVGDLKPYKNVEWAVGFLEALNQNIDSNAQIRLSIEGKPSSENQDKFLMDMANSHKWLSYKPGRLSDLDLSTTLIHSDFVFLPYHRLLTSGIAINAVSHGRPFIAPYAEELDEIGGSECKVLYKDESELEFILRSLCEKKLKYGLAKTYDPSTIFQSTKHLQWLQVVAASSISEILLARQRL